MFSAAEHEQIKRALRFVAEGSLFPEWEFDSLFGFQPSELIDFSRYRPEEPVSERLALAVNGAIIHLLYYPHGNLELVAREVAPIERLTEIGRTWRAAYLPREIE